ncbi:MAG: TonB family protein [Pirellulaceae bacterium]
MHVGRWNKVRINDEGTVDSFRVKTSSGFPALGQTALDTVTTWRFPPALRARRPVPTVVSVPVRAHDPVASMRLLPAGSRGRPSCRCRASHFEKLENLCHKVLTVPT